MVSPVPSAGNDHCPGSADHTIADTGHTVADTGHFLATLLAHVQMAVDHHPEVLF